MQATLFQPFDASRWLKLGFATFLAHLSAAGLVFFSSAAILPRGLTAWREHATLLPLLLFSIPVALLLGGSLYLICLYLGSRAAFMTLHMLLRRDYSMANAFRPYGRQAASFFFWNTGLFLTGMASSFFLLGIPAWLLADGWPGVAWMGVPVLALAGAVFLLALGFVQTLASDFVAPLMWRHDLDILQAWARLLPLLVRRLPSFLLFYLAKLAIGLLVALGLAAMGFFTCCLFYPLALLPVLGQAILQPVFVFFRFFPLAYLEALDPDEGPFIP
jgi:hypothetical protein